jgi:PAS domain S-box-containing protein
MQMNRSNNDANGSVAPTSSGLLLLIQHYAVAVSSVGVALGTSLLLQHFHFRVPAAPLFLFAVAVSSWYGGTGPAVMSAILSTISVYWYFVEPVRTVYIYTSEVPYFIIFVAFAALTSWFATIRRRGEAVLREQANLLSLTHDAIFVADMPGVIKYWNRGAEERYGWTAEQAVGRDVHDLLKTVFPAPLEQIKAEVIRTGRWEGELVHIRKNGTQVVVASRWALQRGKQGAPAAILETNNDITERKQAEDRLRHSIEALRQSEAYLAESQTLTHTGSWALDLASEKYVYVSEEDFRIWGFDPKEGPPTREAVFRRIHPEDRYRWGRNFENSLREKTDNFDEYRIVLPDGTVKHIHTLRHPVLNDAGDLVKLVGTTIDITERKQAEEALRESEGKYHELVEHANSIILHWQRDGRIIHLNEFGQRFFGYSESEIRGRHVIGTIVPETESSGRDLNTLMDEICANPSAFEQNVNENMRRNGEHVWIAWTNKVHLNSQGQVTEILSIGLDITDRKRAEEALRRSEAYLSEAQRLAHTGSWALDVAADKYAYCSEECLRIYGFDPQKGLPTREAVFRRIHPKDWDRVTRRFEKSLREKVDSSDELRIVLPDGMMKHVHVIRHPVLNDAGDVVTVIGTAIDITEHKRAEEALRRSEAYLAEAQRLAHMGAYAINGTSREATYWSEGLFRIFGFDLQHGIPTGGQVWQRVHPEDLDNFKQSLDRAIHEKVDSEVEYRIVLPHGTVKHLHVIGHPVVDENGDVAELVGTAIDVTERKRAEEALRESETRFRTFVDHAADALFILDFEHGTIVDVNRQACESLGCTRQELIGTTALAFHLDSDQAEMASIAQRAAAGETVIDRHWHRRKDGTLFPVEAHTSQYWYGGRRFLLKVARDISERVRAEEQRERLRQLEADLAHINRISMLGELAASIAHEVNQPLSGVVSNGSACLRWLGGDVPNVEEAREAARRIVRDGKRAGEVIARIRALTKRAATPREKLDLNEITREVLALVGDEAKRKSVIIRTQFADDLSPISGDHVQLQQVMLNLVMNAMEAMSSVDERSRELLITTRNLEAGQVQVTVKDSGTGLDPNTVDKIFDPFYTTKPGGMGMGLSISRSILQAHGGWLWAAAKDGPGTIFHFSLPKYREEESHEEV